MKYFVLVLLMVGFVSAINVDFNCPDSVMVDEEFVCSLSVSEGEGIYDVKFYIRGDGGMINRIWVNESWQRTDWYAKDLIRNNEKIDVKLKIDKEFYGTANGIFKLRKNKKIVFDEDFLIEIIQNKNDAKKEAGGGDEDVEEDVEEIEEEIIEKEVDVVAEEISDEIVLSPRYSFGESEKKVEVISLNNKSPEKGDELVYVSKSARAIGYLPYVFAVFLIFVIGILIWERF